MSGITEGGCACGAIRYVFNDQAVFSFHRQCRDCQRASDGGHASSFIVRLECVNLTGEVQYYKRQTASGNVVSQDFCPKCGSPMFNRNFGYPDSLFIHAATLDDPFTFKSQKVVYREEVQSWAAL